MTSLVSEKFICSVSIASSLIQHPIDFQPICVSSFISLKVKIRYPNAKIVAAGFSLGANLLVRTPLKCV
jgi:predicted alpha/beta-fold hydrolase